MATFSWSSKPENKKTSILKSVSGLITPIPKIKSVVSKIINSEPVQKQIQKENVLSSQPLKTQAVVKAKQTGNTIRDLVGSVIGGASYLGKSAQDVIVPGLREKTTTPLQRDIEKKVFGKIAPKNETIQQFVKKDVIPFSEKHNLPKGVTVPVAVIGSIFLENPGNPAKGILKPVAKDALRFVTKLFKEEGEDVAKIALKKIIPAEQHGLAEDAIQTMKALKENDALDEDYLVKYVEDNVPPIKSTETPIPKEDYSEMSDFIVGKKSDFDILQKKAIELDRRVAQRSEKLKQGLSRGVEAMEKRWMFEIMKDPYIDRNQIDNVRRFFKEVGPELFDDIGLRIRKSSDGAQGRYGFHNNVIEIFKDNIFKGDSKFDRTKIHELWHSLSRYLPENDINSVKKSFRIEKGNYIKKNPWFNWVVNNPGGLSKKTYKQFIDKFGEEFNKYISYQPGLYGSDGSYKWLFDDENYRFKNLDEWFAESLTDKTFDRFKTMDENARSIILHTKNLVRKIINYIQRVFGKDTAGRIADNFFNGKNTELVRQNNLRNKVNGFEFKKVSPKLLEEKAVKQEQAPEVPPTQETDPTPLKLEKFDSYKKDITKFANSKLNLDNLSISDDGRKLLEDVAGEIKPRIEESIGYKLSNKEVLQKAEESSKIIEDTVGRDETAEWASKLLKTRQKLATLAETGKVDQELIDTFLAIKTQGTDIARKLQSLSIKADPEKNSTMLTILEAISKTTNDMDAVLKEAEGVDFNNFEQATEFFRKFVKPNIGEWIDLLRYNSMLSSPKTHVVNIFSNLLSTSFMAPIEKTVRGGVDFIGSKLGKRERRYFAGEGGAYLKNYFKSVKTASQKFSNVMKNKDSYTNLDLRDLPLSQKGVKGKIAKVLSVPTKLLEATDQFFMALTEGAETGALKYRKSKGAIVEDLKKQARKDAQYRTYRQELFDENQGPVLDAIDQLTSLVQQARKSKNPIVSNVAKFTIPFLQTPMNIMKQGIEYSPLGVTTVFGAKNKTEQVTKAIIGSSVFAGAATLLMSDRLTFAEPTGANQKAQFRAEGKQPYSVKIGNKWVSFQKLPPQLSFPLAMVAGIDDAKKNQGMDDTTGDLILSSIAKIARFTSDQSYAKSFGELIAAVQGEEDAMARLFSNYPQQLVPFRALSGWFARIIDDTQRKIDVDASFIEKQVQLLMMNIPGLSDEVPARLGPNGRPIENQNRYFNALSPVSITEQRRVSGGNRSSRKGGGGSSGGGGFSWSQ